MQLQSNFRQSRVQLPRWRYGLGIGLLAIAYALVTHLVLAIPIESERFSIWPLWFPAGFAQAALLIWGRRYWPAIFLGTLLPSLADGRGWQYSAIAAVNNALQIWLGAVWLQRAQFQWQRLRLHDIWLLMGWAGVLGSAVSATIGVLNVRYAFNLPWTDIQRLWLEWWIGNATGIITLTPLLLLLRSHRPHRLLRQWWEASFWLGILLATSWLVFIAPTPLRLAYLPFPLAIWAAFRFGRTSVALSVLVVTTAATWGLLNGRGPFANGLSSEAAFVSLQAYICTFALASLTLAAVVAEREEIARSLSQEKEKSERLLLNVLPRPIAERLKQETGTIADNFAETTVLFADIVDFTRLSAQLSPAALVSLLNEIFSEFDSLADRHGLEKIKTIGDAYMVVGGLPQPRADHARAIAEMALDMQAAIATFADDCEQPLQLRIGLHSGPAIAGVIGRRKFIYDLWGDTVNTASRMESHGLVGAIQATQATYQRLYEDYHWQRRGQVRVKGKGYMQTYLLVGRKAARSLEPVLPSPLPLSS